MLDIFTVIITIRFKLQEIKEMYQQEEDCLSVYAASWSSSNTNAVKSDGYDTMDEMEEITEWEVIDEVGESSEEEAPTEAQRLIVERSPEREVESEASDQKDDDKVETENVEHLDNVTVTIDNDTYLRSVKATRLTKDLRLNQVRPSVKPGPSGPSGDREDQQSVVPVIRIIPDLQNRLPKGLKSYERLPSELLPDDIRRCPICEIPKRSHIRRHILITHVPWFWSPTTACWICQEQASHKTSLIYKHSIGHSHIDLDTFNEANLHKWCYLMNGAFYLLIHWLNLENLDDLLTYVRERKIQARGTFSEADIRCMTFYTKHYSDQQVQRFQINPVNHVICIMHTEIISRLLIRIKTDRRLQHFTKSHRQLTSSGMNINAEIPLTITESFEFIDTHFHLDSLAQKLHRPTSSPFTFQSIQDLIAPNCKNQLLYGIANYVYPYHWQSWQEQVDNDKIRTTFGIHPHIAARGTTKRQQQQLEKYIKTEKCIAIGETGLDYTTICGCIKDGNQCQSPQTCFERIKANQEDALLFHLQLASQNNLPVVLHCRDQGDGSAATRTLEIIMQNGFTHLKFHRHCFCGTLDELDAWKKLPQIVFGITGKTSTSEDLQIHNAAARIPDNQLILETDAPYLPPFTGCKINHPWNLIDIAIFLAKLRNSPLPFLIDLTNTNSRNFYRL